MNVSNRRSPQDSTEGTDEVLELIESVPQEAPDDDSNVTNEQGEGKEMEGGQIEVVVEDEVTKKRKRFR